MGRGCVWGRGRGRRAVGAAGTGRFAEAALFTQRRKEGAREKERCAKRLKQDSLAQWRKSAGIENPTLCAFAPLREPIGLDAAWANPETPEPPGE